MEIYKNAIEFKLLLFFFLSIVLFYSGIELNYLIQSNWNCNNYNIPQIKAIEE